MTEEHREIRPFTRRFGIDPRVNALLWERWRVDFGWPDCACAMLWAGTVVLLAIFHWTDRVPGHTYKWLVLAGGNALLVLWFLRWFQSQFSAGGLSSWLALKPIGNARLYAVIAAYQACLYVVLAAMFLILIYAWLGLDGVRKVFEPYVSLSWLVIVAGLAAIGQNVALLVRVVFRGTKDILSIAAAVTPMVVTLYFCIALFSPPLTADAAIVHGAAVYAIVLPSIPVGMWALKRLRLQAVRIQTIHQPEARERSGSTVAALPFPSALHAQTWFESQARLGWVRWQYPCVAIATVCCAGLFPGFFLEPEEAFWQFSRAACFVMVTFSFHILLSEERARHWHSQRISSPSLRFLFTRPISPRMLALARLRSSILCHVPAACCLTVSLWLLECPIQYLFGYERTTPDVLASQLFVVFALIFVSWSMTNSFDLAATSFLFTVLVWILGVKESVAWIWPGILFCTGMFVILSTSISAQHAHRRGLVTSKELTFGAVLMACALGLVLVILAAQGANPFAMAPYAMFCMCLPGTSVLSQLNRAYIERITHAE